ncbi:MAG: hypothetical protein AB1791_20365 [Chloroflexota bacterium]
MAGSKSDLPPATCHLLPATRLMNHLQQQTLDHLIAASADNRVTKPGAVAFGERNRAEARHSSIPGGYQAKSTLYGQQSQASGQFANPGDAQRSSLVARAITTDATVTTLFLDGAAERPTLADNTTWLFRLHVVARRTDAANESAAYILEGCIDRQVGVGTTALVGAVAKTVLAEDTAAWDANVAADAVNGALQITVTGEAGKTIRWVAHVELVEVGA